jgi:hypothetical protein
MTKYEIVTDQFEMKLGTCRDSRSLTSRDVFDEGWALDGSCPRTVASYEDRDAALAAFRTDWADYGSTDAQRSYYGGWLLTGRIARLVVNEYDDDGEFDQGGDVIEFSAEPYLAPGTYHVRSGWADQWPGTDDELDDDALRDLARQQGGDAYDALSRLMTMVEVE